MFILEYMERILSAPIKTEKNFIEIMIGVELSGEAKKITDYLEESISFEDESFFRILSKEEIKDCEIDMRVCFSEYALFPIIDVGDNDYICFNYMKNNWCKFNIVDEVSFSQKVSIMDYFVHQ